MIRTYIVYKHTTPSGKVYIGITSQSANERWRNGRGYKQNQPFWKAIQKYGWQNIKHEIVAENLDKYHAQEIEKDLILLHNSRDKRYGYNVCFGGEDGWVGVKHTQEAREKMSKAKKGKPSSRKGCHLSDETKLKLSVSHKGKYRGGRIMPHWDYDENGKRVFSEEHRRKISEKLKGKPKTQTAIEHNRAAQKCKRVTCVDSGITYPSLGEASRALGIDKTQISRVCNGRIKTTSGLTFVWCNEVEDDGR